MKSRLTGLTLALGALLAAPAFAAGDDAEIFSETILINDIAVLGLVEVDGRIRVNAESAATVDQDQTTRSNASLGDGDHDAALTDDALSGAEGNIGVNVAAGVGNAQANDGAISAVDGENAYASAMVFSSQASLANFGTSGDDDTFYRATLDGNALAAARGNIGVNVAAGIGNAQSNAMAASANSSGVLAVAAADSEQDSFLNELAADVDLDTFATLGGGALSGAQGNIGVNVAAGVGNLQHNGLAIATASCGTCAGGGGGGE